VVEMTKEYFKENILNLRRAKNWSQEKLAEEAGVSYHTVFRAEAGVIPRGPNIEKLAKALGVSQATLFDDPSTLNKAQELAQNPENRILQKIEALIDHKNGPSLDPKKRELFDLIASLSPSDVEIFIGMIKRRLGRKSDDIREP
jgi:transcriptional regulator with XRE-family HTH domain